MTTDSEEMKWNNVRLFFLLPARRARKEKTNKEPKYRLYDLKIVIVIASDSIRMIIMDTLVKQSSKLVANIIAIITKKIIFVFFFSLSFFFFAIVLHERSWKKKARSKVTDVQSDI